MRKTKDELSKMRAEIGRRGGLATKKKAPKGFYSTIAKKGLKIRWHILDEESKKEK